MKENKIQNTSWNYILRNNFTSLDALADFLQLSDEQKKSLDPHSEFILNLPLRLANKITKGTLNDPLFLQFVPLQAEKNEHTGFVKDPVCDSSFRKKAKLLHKYQGRALLVTTSSCAMHCRYCFRKNFPYETKQPSFEEELFYIQDNCDIEEVLLSGGDPLSLSNRAFADLIKKLEGITHIRRIRIHTRFLTGIPERLDDALLDILGSCIKKIIIVIHSNHVNEFDQDVWEALKKLQMLGIPVLNQTVLLKGVNDSKNALRALFETLIDHGVLPYYLHQLDRVQGTHHFEVSEETGKALIQALQKELPGYAIPRYVREIAGEASKTPL